MMKLIERTRYAENYHAGGNNYVLKTLGNIFNRQDWNGESEIWTPESFTMEDVINEGGNIRSIRTGHWAYAMNIGKTAQAGFAGNEFRVYPIRSNLSAFYSIAPQTAVDLTIEAIPSRRALKISKDTQDVQFAFYVGVQGWKVANLIRPSYDKNTFQQRTMVLAASFSPGRVRCYSANLEHRVLRDRLAGARRLKEFLEPDPLDSASRVGENHYPPGAHVRF